jgi:hypothetical protein
MDGKRALAKLSEWGRQYVTELSTHCHFACWKRGEAVVNIPGTNLTGATSVLVRRQHFGRSNIFLFLVENNWSMFHLMHSQLA